ncbi:MAG TPA: amidohydrolase family protein [Actinomycetota bacterium]|nr:amidohydrolase family protein [Actinomycetota bacterium]
MKAYTIPPRATRPVALVDVNVLTMKSDEVTRAQTLIIDGGRITTIGPRDQVRVDGMRVIDCAGRFVLPGLADMHVHVWGLNVMGQFLANGVTTVRNMWGDGYHRAVERMNRAGELAGPHLMTTSPLIDGLGEQGRTIWPYSGYIDDDLAGARTLVARYADQGYDQIKAYSLLNRDQLKALGKACREHGVRLVGHCPSPLTFEESIELGMSCFEHLTNVFHGHFKDGRTLDGLAGWDPATAKKILKMIIEHADMDALRHLADSMAEREVWNCVTTTVWKSPVEGAEAFTDGRMRYVSPETSAWWKFRSPPDEEVRALSRPAIERRIEVLSCLREAGAPVLVGTDTPNPFVVEGFSLHDELDNFVRAGFSNFEAIRIATAEAARFAGEVDEWGTLEVGMRSDLVIADSDPRKDLAVLRHPWAVASNGYFFERADLDRLLAERAEAVAAAAEPQTEHVEHSHQHRHMTKRAAAVVGKLCCNAMPRDGGLMIEEAYSTNQSTQKRTVYLGPRREVLRYVEVRSTDAGSSTIAIDREENGYRSEFNDFDGFASTSRIDSAPLFPSEEFGFTAVSEFALTSQDGQEFESLAIQSGEMSVLPAKVTHSEDGVTIEWLRRGWPTSQTYRTDEAGRVTAMTESAWMQQIELTEDPPGAAEG